MLQSREKLPNHLISHVYNWPETFMNLVSKVNWKERQFIQSKMSQVNTSLLMIPAFLAYHNDIKHTDTKLEEENCDDPIQETMVKPKSTNSKFLTDPIFSNVSV